MYLALRTDSSVSEYYLVNSDGEVIDCLKWESRRDLADGILKKLEEFLKTNKKDWYEIDGIVVFKGPGSFTGLRIGITVANSISYVKKIPIIAEIGDDWLMSGTTKLMAGKNDKQVIPEYGAEPNITKPVK